MVFISNAKLKNKHAKVPMDIYFDNLEEAYGNLPIPSDDWAGIKQLLAENYHNASLESIEAFKLATIDIENLEEACETIRNHYELVAKLLGKEQKYG